MEILRAFHGDPAIKAKYLSRVAAHREADQLIQGLGWDKKQSKGCAVGCTLDAYDHSRYPIELGVPVNLAYTEDHIFERLPKEQAMLWPERFLAAIPVGADLTLVVDKAMLWVREQDAPPSDLPEEDRARSEALNVLFRRRIAGDEPTDAEWKRIEEAARDARAARAARDARDAWDAWAARDARDAWAAWAAWDAWAARDAWDAWDARDAFYAKLADQIIVLIETSPVPTVVADGQ